jgi:hypothetical protein
VLIITGIVAVLAMVLMFASEAHIVPQWVSTYTLQPVVFYNEAGMADAFDSRAAYLASEWNTKYKTCTWSACSSTATGTSAPRPSRP